MLTKVGPHQKSNDVMNKNTNEIKSRITITTLLQPNFTYLSTPTGFHPVLAKTIKCHIMHH